MYVLSPSTADSLIEGIIMQRIQIIVFLLSLVIASPVYADINSSLIVAAKKGDTATVQSLLDKGANVNAKNKGFLNQTVLIVAVEKGHISIVKTLLDKDADVNTKDFWGNTALIEAAVKGHTDIVKLLLAKGADINAKNLNGKSALMEAIAKGHTEIVELLKKAGGNKHNTLAKIKDINSDLFLAATEGRIVTVETILDKGAEVNAKNSKGRTALMLAALNSHKDTVEILLNKGADVNIKNNEGMTALMYAAKKGLSPVPTVQTLLDKMMKKGNLPALKPTVSNEYKDIVVILLNKGADVNAKNNNGWTALMFAEFENHTEIVNILKQAGAK